MNALNVMFGAITPEDALEQWRNVSSGVRDTLIIFAAIGAVLVGISLWVVFFRNPSRRHHHRHHHEQHPSRASAPEAAVKEDADEPPQHQRRKGRRVRRPHRARNPTLAETGGLPPVRTGDPPEIQP